jgi:hypothetical protein
MGKRWRRFVVCTVKKQHQWDVSEKYVRNCVFCRADCELCGEVIDATKLVAILDKLRESDSRSRIASIVETMAAGFKREEEPT